MELRETHNRLSASAGPDSPSSGGSIYATHNENPSSEAALLKLREAPRAELSTRTAEGIRVVGFGPTHDGYLHVRVMDDVPTAQARFDSMHDSNVARVEYGEPVQLLPLREP